MDSRIRVCVIGAGPSGLSTLYNFAKLPEVPDIVCYEKQKTFGGFWNYDWRTGVDANGEPSHAGMYKNLWTNGPKECLEYPDYTFEGHFGRPIPSYPSRAVMRDYLQGRFVTKSPFELQRFIQYNTAVKNVSYDDEKQTYKVTAKNLITQALTEETFTHVIVATGIYNVPNTTDYPGFNSFPGRISHSHDFRDGKEYSGQRLLVIGGSYSAEDIALNSIKFGAKHVIISWRTKPLQLKWPKGIEERPCLVELKGNLATFKDGSTAEIDSIILCTGYTNQFPFLERRFLIDSKTSLYPVGLYKGSVFLGAGDKNFFYVGVQTQLYTMTMFDSIAAWVVRYIMGLIPDEPKTIEDMKDDSRKWRERSEAIIDLPGIIDFQTEFMASLADDTGYSKQICQSSSLFKQWVEHRQENMATYRDHSFRSIYTGNMAPTQKPFMEHKDDSLEGYLSSF